MSRGQWSCFPESASALYQTPPLSVFYPLSAACMRRNADSRTISRERCQGGVIANIFVEIQYALTERASQHFRCSPVIRQSTFPFRIVVRTRPITVLTTSQRRPPSATVFPNLFPITWHPVCNWMHDRIKDIHLEGGRMRFAIHPCFVHTRAQQREEIRV